MQRDRLFELRVLTGTHAGARALLPDAPTVLGSGEDCDLILTDEGVLTRHARLEHEADGSTVLRWLEGDLPPLVIRPGQGAQLGPVQIAIESQEAPWRAEVPICEPAIAADPVPSHEPGDEGALADTEPAPQPQPTSPPASSAAAASRLWAGVLGVLALASVAATWWALRAAPAPKPLPAPAPAPLQAPDPAPVQRVLAQLGLGERVQVEVHPGRPVLVRASLLSDEETERLAMALSRLAPRPSLKLLALQDLQAELESALAHDDDGARAPLSVRYLGDIRFQLAGRVADERRREEVLAAVAHKLPRGLRLESALQTDAQAGAALVEELRSQGLDVSGHWDRDHLALAVSLSPAEVPRWERLLLAAAARHPLPFRAELHLVHPPPVHLPFVVRSVVGSATPYLVLSDGRKLVAGASVEGWQLVEIRPQAVVFQGAEGRRITLER